MDFSTPDVTNDPSFSGDTLDALLGSGSDLVLQEGSLYNIRDTIEFGTPYTVLQFEFQVSGASEITIILDTINGVFSAPVKFIDS